MIFNAYQLIILFGILLGIAYIVVLTSLKVFRSRSNFFLAMLILAFVGNLGQYWLRDMGWITNNTLQLIFFPWQVLVPPLFLLYISSLQVFNLRPISPFILFTPFILLIFGHLVIKIDILNVGLSSWKLQPWMTTFNLAEEMISVLYCIGVTIAVYRIIWRQRKYNDLQGFGINKNIVRWILKMVLMGLVMSIVWLISLILFNQSDFVNNYYALWILMTVVLVFIGATGIYHTVQQGPFIISKLPIQSLSHSEVIPKDQDASPLSLSIASPTKYFDPDMIEALLGLSNSLSMINDVSNLEEKFETWLMKEFEIDRVSFSHFVSKSDLKGIAQLSSNLRQLTIPYRNLNRQLGSFQIVSNAHQNFHERHLYYLKMAAKTYSFHLAQVSKNIPNITSDNPVFTRLEKLMKNNHLYKENKIDLHTLATRLHISEGYLSKIINDVTGLHFNDWLNGYRIDHVKNLMQDPDFDHFSISGYGYEAGFNSKSTFYKAFSKKMGQSPGSYRKTLNNSEPRYSPQQKP